SLLKRSSVDATPTSPPQAWPVTSLQQSPLQGIPPSHLQDPPQSAPPPSLPAEAAPSSAPAQPAKSTSPTHDVRANTDAPLSAAPTEVLSAEPGDAQEEYHDVDQDGGHHHTSHEHTTAAPTEIANGTDANTGSSDTLHGESASYHSAHES